MEDTDAVNLALGKPTSMSSNIGTNTPAKAVDGNRNSTLKGNSCSQTKSEINAWWQVDLQAVYVIWTVTITNRGDCCGELSGNVPLICLSRKSVKGSREHTATDTANNDITPECYYEIVHTKWNVTKKREQNPEWMMGTMLKSK